MTIKDLAARSGYSLGTVSRVLNNHPSVSPKARERIMSIVEQEGFELNATAKNLKQTRSNTVLTVVRGSNNELFALLVEQLQALSAQSPYHLSVDYIHEEDDEVRRAVKLSREIKPRGILFLGGSRRNFSASFGAVSAPSVLVTNSARDLGFDNLSSVTTDDRSAAAAAIRFLQEMGHREIGVITGETEDSDTGRERLLGCLDAFREQGMSFDVDNRTRFARYSYAGGYAAMMDLLHTAPELTAVFAVSDVMAIGAARAAGDEGKQIPRDLSLIGFDGLPICDYYHPRLATVVQQTDYLARQSWLLLTEAMEKKTPPRHILAPFFLEKNGSVRPLGRPAAETEDRL